jgi:Ca2+-transporting ATPase
MSASGAVSITQTELDSFNSDEALQVNVKALQSIGGISGLLQKLNTDISEGISDSEDSLAARAESFGANFFPEPECTTWMQLFIASFNDTTLQILIVAAAISLGVGLYEDPDKGWIEGVAIIIAILIVAIVTASNDYEKEKQFRKLNAVKDDVFVTAVRGGHSMRIKARELVVGDLVKLHAGDKIPADGVVVAAVDVTANESSLTGEPDDKPKAALAATSSKAVSKKRGKNAAVADEEDEIDPFLLSGTTLSSGFCTMVATAVGESSKWGQTKAKLAVEHEDTPLQEKLDTLAAQIGIGGLVAAVATFAVMMIQWKFFPDISHLPGVTFIQYIIRASIMAVTIVVVAVPEGLPLAVTISLAYSTQKMMKVNK